VWQVTKGTVDEGIHALAEKKLRLDAAVLDGITASSKQAKASENLAMSELLQSLIAGKSLPAPILRACSPYCALPDEFCKVKSMLELRSGCSISPRPQVTKLLTFRRSKSMPPIFKLLLFRVADKKMCPHTFAAGSPPPPHQTAQTTPRPHSQFE